MKKFKVTFSMKLGNNADFANVHDILRLLFKAGLEMLDAHGVKEVKIEEVTQVLAEGPGGGR